VRALRQTGLGRLVISGGVSANRVLREKLAHASAQARGSGTPIEVYFPELALCTDNGAMIAFAAALRLQAAQREPDRTTSFDVRPRWPLAELN